MRQANSTLIATAAALALATSLASAQDAPKDKSAKPVAAKPAASSSAKPGAKPTSPVVGRDWTKIDTNKDHSISPEEMEVWLKANGPDSK